MTFSGDPKKDHSSQAYCRPRYGEKRRQPLTCHRRSADKNAGNAACARADALIQHLAPLRGQPLGIVEPARHVVGIENDRSGDDRPGEWAAAGLVAAGDRPDAALERRPLAPERRAQNLFVEWQTGRRGSIATHAAMMTTGRRDPQRSTAISENCGENVARAERSETGAHADSIGGRFKPRGTDDSQSRFAAAARNPRFKPCRHGASQPCPC